MRSNRRKFLKTSAASAASFQIVPRYVIGGQGHTPPSETYGAALIGCGGRGPGTYEPMVRKLIFFILALFFNAISCAAQKTGENFREKESRPNVLIFFIDDLGWSDLGCYGSEFHLTPNIDRLAASGLKFNSAYSSSSVCSPTRSSLMTGKHPVRFGITDWIGASQKRRILVTPKNNSFLPKKEVTLAEVFKGSGYETAYFGKWHLGSRDEDHPSFHGFNYHRGVNKVGSPGSYYYPFRRNKKLPKKPLQPSDIPNFSNAPKDSYLTDLLSQEAADFIGKKSKNPFFAILSHYSVHTPIQARELDAKKYRQRMNKIDISAEIKTRKERESTTRISQNNPEYAAMVESVDRSVGRVMNKLKEVGIIENTLVIFTSDNGGLSTLQRNLRSGPASCLPLRAGKGWLYEGGIKIPTIISWPGKIAPDSLSDTPITTCDIYPTLLTSAGLINKSNQSFDGVDLTPLFKNKELKERSLFWHFPHYHGSGNRPSSSIRKGLFKLIRWYEDGSEELYNLKTDLSEENDLSKVNASKRAELSNELSHWLKSSGAHLPEMNQNN